MRLLILLIPFLTFGQDGEAGYMSNWPWTHQQLVDSGYCDSFAPPVFDFYKCYSLIPCDSVVWIDVAWTIDGCTSIKFSRKTFFDTSWDTLGTGQSITYGDTLIWCVYGEVSGPWCNGFIDVCPYYLEYCPPLLPVFISKLTGYFRDGRAYISWTTYTEIENSHFLLERNNKTIAVIKGRGTAYNPKEYLHVDTAPEEMNYYELKQVDEDGTVHFVGLIGIRGEKKNYIILDRLGRFRRVDTEKPRFGKDLGGGYWLEF